MRRNGQYIKLFDFGYAVQLWLHYANHSVGASAQTTTLQREQALQIQAYPWGVCEIPLEIRGEVSDESARKKRKNTLRLKTNPKITKKRKKKRTRNYKIKRQRKRTRSRRALLNLMLMMARRDSRPSPSSLAPFP